jgi:hypothetical protein
VDRQAGAQVAGRANQIADVPVAALHSESSQAVYHADLLLYRGNSSASVCPSYTSAVSSRAFHVHNSGGGSSLLLSVDMYNHSFTPTGRLDSTQNPSPRLVHFSAILEASSADRWTPRRSLTKPIEVPVARFIISSWYCSSSRGGPKGG